MNLVILTVLYKIIKTKSSLYRILCSANIGALGACISVIYPDMNFIVRFIFLFFILSLLMVRIAFIYNGLRQLLVNTIKLYIVSFMIGGAIEFLAYNTNLSNYMKRMLQGRIYQSMNVRLILTSCILIIISLPLVLRVMDEIRVQLHEIYPVELIINNHKLDTYGLVDSGNLLREPISDKPVLIGEYEVLYPLLPVELKDYETKIKVIPYHSLGKENGTLYGVVFDQVNIKMNNGVKENKNVIVGMYHGTLSSRKEYQIILHKDILL